MAKYKSGYDKKMEYDSLLKEFIQEMENKEKNPNGVSKFNFEMVRCMNEYLDKSRYFQKITYVILLFLKEFEYIDDSIISKFVHIKQSVKQQFYLFLQVKDGLKKQSVPDKYKKVIPYEIKKASERIDYLLKNIIPIYIEMTPLFSYQKKLKEEGKDLYSDISESLKLNENMMENPEVELYIKKVYASLSNENDWEEGFNQYMEFMQLKKQRIEESKNAEREIKKAKKKEDAEATLYIKAKILEHNYMNGTASNGNHSRIIASLGLKRQEMKFAGKNNCKLVLLAKTGAGSKAATMYFCENSENFMTSALSKATLLEEKEELPDKLLEQIQNNDIAFVELMLV